MCRNLFWTVGEVHFLAKGTRETFPDLQKSIAAFKKWLSSFERVYSSQEQPGEFDNYLEGSTRNYGDI